MRTLMIMEISKKQHYIFKSKKLKDHIGASTIIRYITERLDKDVDELNLEKYDGSIVLKGGGKSIYIFEKENKAKEYIHNFSKYVLQNFAGIELFMTYITYDENKENDINAIDLLYKKLALKKDKREHSFCLVDYGINKVCKESRVPANIEKFNNRENISNEIRNKIEFANRIEEEKNKPLKYLNSDEALDFFHKLLPENTIYQDDLQQTEEDSKNMIAVVHIDGNDMGKKIAQIKNNFQNLSLKEINESYIKKLNEFSKSVDKAYQDAFKETVEVLKDTISKKQKNNETIILPVRPLILAGDDVCFITSAEYGIEFSRVFIEKLIKKEDSVGNKLAACAGIAIVKSKYPFFKAYELSEQLCSNAKKMLAQLEIEGAALDWHVSFGEIGMPITEIRNKNYYTEEDIAVKLNQRPYVLIKLKGDNKCEPPTYEKFMESKEMVDRVTKTSRNTIKTLRNAIKIGPVATKDYFNIHKTTIKEQMLENEFVIHDIDFIERTRKNFYAASRSFDAIEVMDVFSKLEVTK